MHTSLIVYRRWFRNFTRVYAQEHIETSFAEKTAILLSNGCAALANPARGECVAAVGDIVSPPMLGKLRDSMRNSSDGARILQERPLINSSWISLENLQKLPAGSLGKDYLRFMNTYGYHMHERTPVQYVDDEELAYVLTRYRQLHDFVHVLYGVNTTVEGELLLKLIELIHSGLPIALVSCLVGPFTVPLIRNRAVQFVKQADKQKHTISLGGLPLSFHNGDYEGFEVIGTHAGVSQTVEEQRIVLEMDEKAQNYLKTYFENFRNEDSFTLKETFRPKKVLFSKLFPWALNAGLQSKSLYNVYVEDWLDKPTGELRKHCCISDMPFDLNPYVGLDHRLPLTEKTSY